MRVALRVLWSGFLAVGLFFFLSILGTILFGDSKAVGVLALGGVGLLLWAIWRPHS